MSRRDEQARIRRLEALARQESDVWARVVESIQQRNARGYDQAVALLSELHELAEYSGKQAAFQERLEQLRQQFSSLSSLKARLVEARLIKR